ncbi:MFS transporter [Ruegeria sp.]|uniref:MFS transporter n=1 Tax=Ruegeria sp. TaxID=1879320 RepID=UPI00231D3F93|nr:MFS transporter [Ruegeria sp.]MDA7963455.1 MFS transporter [Ruegeria sp.]
MTNRDTQYYLLLNAGHFLDHYIMLIFATVAALALSGGWQMSYAELLPLGTAGFAAFAICALPAGWMADRWGRDRMMVVFFAGIGAASVLTGLARTPWQLGAGLFLIGVFASIYHPVGLAIVTTRWNKTGMRLAVNGVWGNLGVGLAALVTGLLIDLGNWRAAFVLPGVLSMALAWPYYRVTSDIRVQGIAPKGGTQQAQSQPGTGFWRVMFCVFLTAALGSAVFQSTTVALPEIFEERVSDLATHIAGQLGDTGTRSASVLGALAFSVFAAASLAQLVTGQMLDRIGARPTLVLVSFSQVVFFLLMPGLSGWAAYGVALCFMLGVFGLIPINDFLIGTTTSRENRAKAMGLRYLVIFLTMSGVLPMIAWVHVAWGFDGLFRVLAVFAFAIFLGGLILLPKTRTRMAGEVR